MKIEAIAKLRYWSGDTISTSPERLEIVVQFKEYGKWTKTKLVDVVSSTRWIYDRFFDVYDTYDDYLDTVDSWINDKYLIKLKVEDMVKKHFEEVSNEQRKKQLMKAANNSETIKVNVEIK